MVFTLAQPCLFFIDWYPKKVAKRKRLFTGTVPVNNFCLTSTLKFLILYVMPALRAECQYQEAWPASIWEKGISEKKGGKGFRSIRNYWQYFTFEFPPLLSPLPCYLNLFQKLKFSADQIKKNSQCEFKFNDQNIRKTEYLVINILVVIVKSYIERFPQKW